MDSVAQKRVLLAAMVGLCEVVALHSALAGPPLEKVTAALSHGSKDNRSAAVVPTLKERLDLRPPANAMESNQGVAASLAAPGRYRLFSGQLPWKSDARAFSPPVSQNEHIMSPMETLTHNFQHEGLPVAKLFQSNQSLVHLGLNPKGKPGLWIIHKLH